MITISFSAADFLAIAEEYKLTAKKGRIISAVKVLASAQVTGFEREECEVEEGSAAN